MENNQEHKIDKIFKHSLENQLVTPPLDAWTSIHTYTIGQEEKKPKVWLKYASLAMVLLLFLGLGVWYYIEKLSVKTQTTTKVENAKSSVKTQTTAIEKSSVRTQTTALQNAGRQFHRGFNPASVNTKSQIIHLDNQSPKLQISGVKKVIQLPKSHTNQKFASSKTSEQEPLIIEIIEDSSINNTTQFERTVSYFDDNNIHEIKSKPLILNDLLNKMQRKSESTIVVLEKKKENLKTDSVAYGNGFSFRHPIISYGLEISNSNWDVMRNIGNNNWVKSDNSYKGEPIRLGYSLKLGISWKVNKRLRSGINLSYGSTDLGNSSSIKIPYSSNSNLVFDYAMKNNSNTYYRVRTSFGELEIPYNLFNNPSFIQKDSSKIPIWFSPNSMKSLGVKFSNQYDLISKKHKRGRRYYYQVYGLLDLNILRQTEYSFRSTDAFFLFASSANPLNTYRIMKDFGHLQNASEFIFGLRAGLGFRYQFAQKWDFFVEGSGQHSLNNWVKSSDIKTFQRTLSLQAGINLNL